MDSCHHKMSMRSTLIISLHIAVNYLEFYNVVTQHNKVDINLDNDQ